MSFFYASQLGYLEDIKEGRYPEEDILYVLNGSASRRKNEEREDEDWIPDADKLVPNKYEKCAAHEFIKYLYEVSPYVALVSSNEEEFTNECCSLAEDILSYSSSRHGSILGDRKNIRGHMIGFYLEEHGRRASGKILEENYVKSLLEVEGPDAAEDFSVEVPGIETEKRLSDGNLVGKSDVFLEGANTVLREIKVVDELRRDHVLQTMGNAYLVDRFYPEKDVECKIINFGLKRDQEIEVDLTEDDRLYLEELFDYGRRLFRDVGCFV